MAAVNLPTSTHHTSLNESSEDNSSTPLCQTTEKTRSIAIELVSNSHEQEHAPSQSLLLSQPTVPAPQDPFATALITGTQEHKRRGSLAYHLTVLNTEKRGSYDNRYYDDKQIYVSDSVLADHTAKQQQQVALAKSQRNNSCCIAAGLISLIAVTTTFVILRVEGRI